jgi:hypothetical protein
MVLRPLIAFLGAIVLAGAASGDTLKLLDGKMVQGTFLGGDARTIRMEVNNKIELFPIAQVESLTFGGGLMAAAAPEKIDPKKAKEEEKARKKAEEEAAKAAKEAAKAQEAAAKAAAKAEEAAAKAKGISGDATQAASKPKTSRWGKAPSVKAPAVPAPAVPAPAVTAPAPPPAAATAGEVASAASAAPGAVGNAAQTAGNVANTANQAAATAQQVSSAVADPGAAAASAAQNAAAGAAQQAASTTQSVQNAARTADTVASAARPSGASSAATSSGRAEQGRSPAGTSAASTATEPVAAPTTPSPAQPPAATPAVSAANATPTAAVPPADPALQETAAVVTGTVFRVRLVETINSAIHKPGEIFRASLENPLVSGNVTVPKGADVMVRLVQVPARGSASPLLTLEAISLRVDYRNLPFAAEAMTQPGDALRGAAGGSGVQVFRGTERLQIPADGVVSFRTVKADNKR